MSFIKEWSHQQRKKSLSLTSSRTINLFIASTLSRAINWKRTNLELQKAEKEAESRWMTAPTPVSKAKKMEVSNSIKVMLGKIDRTVDPRVKIPSSKSCVEATRKKGGVRGTLFKHWRNRGAITLYPERELKFKNKHCRNQNVWGLSPDLSKGDELTPYHEVKWTENLIDLISKDDENALFWADVEGAEMYGPPEITPEKLLQMCLMMQKETITQPMRAVAIPEKGGKIRTATLHPAHEVHLARAIMSRHIPVLQKLGVTREMLNGKEIKLVCDRGNAKLYSADLKQATDRISHELASTVWISWCMRLKEPSWVLQAGQLILDAKTLPDGRATTNGIYMGLGITWIVLNVINIHCALKAKIKFSAFKVCGDDLIAHVTKSQRRAYDDELKVLGLLANYDKEFYDKAGVFCEHILLPHPDNKVLYRSVSVPKLSALGATKFMGGFTNNKLAALQSLPKGTTKATRWLHSKMVSKLKPRKKRELRPGPIAAGGDGSSDTPTTNQLKYALKHGKISMNPKLSKISKELRDKLTVSRVRKSTETETTFDRIRLKHYRLLTFYDALPRGDNLKTKRFLTIASARNKGKATRKSLIKEIRNSRLSNRQKKKFIGKIRKGISIHNRRFHREVWKALCNPPPEYAESDSTLELETKKLSKIFGTSRISLRIQS
jgi:hypothetical protein